VQSNCSHIDLLPTLVELAAGSDWDGYPEPVEGGSLLPLLSAEEPERIAVSEIFSEGVAAPYVMLRKGRYKISFVEHDPPQVFDLVDDPDEVRDLARDPGQKELTRGLVAEVHRQWDLARLKAEVLGSQRRRRFVYRALTTGQVTPWDFQPWEDASRRYYRGTNSYHEAEERDLLGP
jgi:choline-sulfatase